MSTKPAPPLVRRQPTLFWFEPPEFWSCFTSGTSAQLLLSPRQCMFWLIGGAAFSAIAGPSVCDWILPFPNPQWTAGGWMTASICVFAVIVIPLYWLAPTFLAPVTITLGPHGIRRQFISHASNHGCGVDTWEVRWNAIERLVLVEDYVAGGRSWRVLVAFTSNWEQKVLALGNRISREELVGVCWDYKRTLEVATAIELAAMSVGEG